MQEIWKRKTVLAALLGCVCGGAAADWSQVGQDKNGTTYVDRNTVRRNGDKATIWSLYDADVPQLLRENVYAHSTRIQVEYDCGEHTGRTLNMVYYARRMAAGDVLLVRSVPQNWELVAPNSAWAALYKLACPKGKD